MNKVYVVLAGEEYEGSSIVSVHATVGSAIEAATQYAATAMEVDGLQFTRSSEAGWKARSGHYIVITEHAVVG